MTPAAKRDPDATRNAILDAAELEILDHGFAEASTSHIARRAGVTKSLIHHHFGSKQSLWDEVKTRRMAAYAEQQMALFATSDPDAELLHRSLETYFHFLRSNPQLVRLMTWMALEEDQECRDSTRDLMQAAVEKLSAGQQEGYLRADVAPHSLLFLFLACTQYWFQFRRHFALDCGLSPQDPALDERYLSDMLKLYFEGALPPKPDPTD
jgi:TetR/AcrR family transcriptional regulator